MSETAFAIWMTLSVSPICFPLLIVQSQHKTCRYYWNPKLFNYCFNFFGPFLLLQFIACNPDFSLILELTDMQDAR